MPVYISLLGFNLSCVILLFITRLPTTLELTILSVLTLVISLCICCITNCKKLLRTMLCFIVMGLVGILWSTLSAKQYMANILPYIDKQLMVQGIVTTANIDVQDATSKENRFVLFNIDSIDNQELSASVPIVLQWSEQFPAIFAGQKWQLLVQTRASHSRLNEGSFDSQRWSVANRTVLQGRVKSYQLLELEYSLRQTIISSALDSIGQSSRADILIALAFGERERLTEEHKQILMQTGIMHLMAISGMHIMLVALVIWHLVRAAQYILPKQFISLKYPIFISWAGALFYTWLSGMNPPAIRAMIAMSCWLLVYSRQIYLSSWQIYLWVVTLLLLFDPLMALSDSFWLSCYAVASLIFLFQWLPLPKVVKRKKRGYFARLLHLQFGLLILLLPVQFWIFQGMSYGSLIANLVAIPIVSLITFPAILIALILHIFNLSLLESYFWFIANESLEWVLYFIQVVDGSWYYFSKHMYLLSLIGWLGLIIWRTEFWRSFYITIMSGLLLIFLPFWQKEQGVWQLHVLDVGHGLVIVMQQEQDVVLYDTGQLWESGSMAEKVILPFLRWNDFRLIGIIVSHDDSDHRGGLEILQRYYPQSWLLMSSATSPENHCIKGKSWKWISLNFEVLWPLSAVEQARNADSCVVRVFDGKHSVLLTGDLEKAQEYRLVEQYKYGLSSTILQIPHHGSNTSSSYAFLNHVMPEIAVNSIPRYNPWHLPSDKVIARYSDKQIPVFSTASAGQISILFTHENWHVNTYRQQIKPRWYHDWFGALTN
ncbi:DNA internalization-related competence protein ComEC/Rec2 [Zophobihabitans entericus]|uniref:DNA internalization-related competence protein ComEC/Rec2 n=1 Tax=Zophobihabitans entericus TaxID=1635327 RepID=A0A6G9IC62_9GAMM|nr:DNA internalization-related competence protein ComEC/Rec2 [Zophobihabitans entericus]QIQ21821.1 DNA internalization-related competence protein ComEC/Rec2 [Zophobihabitans entericus]